MIDRLKKHISRPRSRGGIREMTAIALPMVVSHGCLTFMTFTDRMFLSRLGPNMMNAAMLGGLTTFMTMTLFMGLIAYSTALVAQYLGSGNKDKCALTVTQSFFIALIAYPLILAARPLIHLLFERMGIIPEQLVYQKLYFDILVYGVIFALLRTVLDCFFSGTGRTKVVMAGAIVAMIVNISMNYVLIFGKLGFPAMGIRGAAYGTVIGGISGVLVLLGVYISKNNRLKYNVLSSFRFDKDVMGTLIRFGYPAGIEMFLNLLAFDVLIMLFHSAGSATATAATVMFNWDMVSFVPLLGMQVGVTSLVGRYMGGRDTFTAHRATMSGFKIGCLYSLVILVLFASFPGTLADVFKPEGVGAIFEQAKPVAVFMIRMASIYVLVEAMLVVFMGALRGAGDTFWAMCISVTMHWILVPMLFFMLKVMEMPAESAWTALVFTFICFSILVWLRYRSGHWKSIRVVSPVKAVAATHDDFHEQSDL